MILWLSYAKHLTAVLCKNMHTHDLVAVLCKHLHINDLMAVLYQNMYLHDVMAVLCKNMHINEGTKFTIRFILLIDISYLGHYKKTRTFLLLRN